MGLLDKISNKITEKIDDTLNSENLNDDSMTAAEIIQSRSEKNYEKHHEEIDRITKKMDILNKIMTL